MPAHGLHSVRYLALLTWLIMFTARLDALPKPFRVACFRARRSTHAFRVLPNAVRRVQVLVLASCLTLNTVRVFSVNRILVLGLGGATLQHVGPLLSMPLTIALGLQTICRGLF